MVIFGTWNGQTISLSLKPNSLTLSLQGQGQSQVYSFDAAGRLWTAMLEDVSYRRGLNGRTVAKWQTTSTGGRERRWLSPAETARLEERARQIVSDLLTALDAGAAQLKTHSPLRTAPSWKPQPDSPRSATRRTCSTITRSTSRWGSCRRTSIWPSSCRPPRAARSIPAPSAPSTATGPSASAAPRTSARMPRR